MVHYSIRSGNDIRVRLILILNLLFEDIYNTDYWIGKIDCSCHRASPKLPNIPL